MDGYRGTTQDPISLHRYLYVADDPVNGVDPSGLFTQAFGYAVEAAIQPFYAASHPGDVVTYGKWARIGFWPSLKPDVLNITNKTFLEIKPFSLSGIYGAAAQMTTYELFFAFEGYRPEAEWVPPRVLQVGLQPVAIVNIGGVLFYTDLFDNLEDLLLIKSLQSTAEMIRILRGARAAASALSEFATIGRLAGVATVGGQSRVDQAVGNAIMLSLFAGFAF